MKQRSPAIIIALNLATFGVYGLYWLKVTRDEMVARGLPVPAFWILLLPTLSIMASWPAYIILVFLSIGRFTTYDTDGQASANPLAIVFYALIAFTFLVLLPALFYWYHRYCQAIAAITKGTTSYAESISLLIVLTILGFNFVWPGIIQNGFNRLANQSRQYPR